MPGETLDDSDGEFDGLVEVVGVVEIVIVTEGDILAVTLGVWVTDADTEELGVTDDESEMDGVIEGVGLGDADGW